MLFEYGELDIDEFKRQIEEENAKRLADAKWTHSWTLKNGTYITLRIPERDREWWTALRERLGKESNG